MTLHHRRHREFCDSRPRALHPPQLPRIHHGPAKWLLTADERALAVERIARDRVSDQESDRSVRYGLKFAARDFRTCVFALMLCSNHTAYGFNNFYPSIAQGFRLGSRLGSDTVTLLLTAPPYLAGAPLSFLATYFSDSSRERGFHIAVPMLVTIVGFAISVGIAISVGTLNVAARYFASFLYITGCFAANMIVFSWAASTLNQTPEKRACTATVVNPLAQLGNIWSPYFFRPRDGPRYFMAILLMMAFSVISIVCCVVVKTVLKRDNEKLRREANAEGRVANLFTL